jgi:chromosome segregation ATPase
VEELIITYLLDKGGIFGLLSAILLFWIVFRERSLFLNNGGNNKKAEKKEDSTALEKILYTNLKDSIVDLKDSMADLNDKAVGIKEKLSDVGGRVEDLWDWHSVKDEEGVPIWYVRRSLEVSITNLEKAIIGLREQITNNLTQLNDIINSKDNISDKLQKVNDERITELKHIIENYNKTMNDLSFALEKIKYVLRSHNGE